MKNRATILTVCIVACGCFHHFVNAATAHDSDMRFILLCKATVNGQLYTQNIEINYLGKTVNGLPAIITENMIKWSSTDYDQYRRGNVLTRHEVNRLAGIYRYWADGTIYASPPPSYSCDKAPLPKF